MALENKIESVKIQGFRSLADVELTDLPDAAVLIGANGSGKSNVFMFLEMVRQMLRYRRLGDFVAKNGGADDQLFGGNSRTSRVTSEIKTITNLGSYNYYTHLQHAHPDRLLVYSERLNYSLAGESAKTEWDHYGRDAESELSNLAHSDWHNGVSVNPLNRCAFDMVKLLGRCSTYQFHNTDDTSNFKKSRDVEDNNRLLPHGGNLAAILWRLEQKDARRYDYICRQIQRIVPNFERFAIEESYGKVMLRWKARRYG